MQRYYPRSFLKLLLIGFTLVALPLIFALINNAVSVDQIANRSQRAVYQAVQATQSSRRVLELHGRPVASADELWQALQGYELGTPLRAAVERKGRRIALEAVLQPAAGPERVFKRTRASGRVELQRSGNQVELRTRGVRRLKLLLSPDQFDFDQPLRVVANGRPVFEGRLQRSASTLLTWAARDNDRTMLFGAELKLDLPAR